jgi:transcriptional regulator with XRE-family HTH domain
VSQARDTDWMEDLRLGSTVRLVRQARGWRQEDLARASGASQSTVSRIERGHLGSLSTDTIRAVASAIDIRIDLVPRWRGGDLDRLMNRGHSALHESVAQMFRDDLPAWVVAPEVSFAVYAERGVMDLLAWHPGRRALLVIELKTDIVDVNELLGTLDRKRRLASRIATERGWNALSVSAWLIVRNSRTSRRRVQAHAAMLAGALPDDRRAVRRWLRDPVGRVAGLSFWTDARGETGRLGKRPIRRVRVVRSGRPERGSG